MRTTTAAFVSLLAAPALARAEPLSPDRADAAPTYVALGLTSGLPGVPHDELLAAGSLEVGRQLTRHIAVHARGVAGEYVTLLAAGGSHRSARAGADLTSCSERARICGFMGLEAGYASSHYLGDGSVDSDTAGAIGALRAGADVRALYALRWRPMIEVSASDRGLDDVKLTQSFAYHF